MDCSPPGSSVHGILQARILEWVAIFFSRESSQPRNWTQGSNPGLLHCRQILYHLNHQGSPKREIELLTKHSESLFLNSLWSFFFFCNNWILSTWNLLPLRILQNNVYWTLSKWELLQSCPTPYDPGDCSLPGSSVHVILQAGILEWVVMLFSGGSSPPPV